MVATASAFANGLTNKFQDKKFQRFQSSNTEALETFCVTTTIMKQKKLLNIIGFCIGLNVGDLFLFGIVRPNMDFLISTLLVTNIVMLVAFVYYTYLSRKKEQK